MILPVGVGQWGGQAEGPGRCWADVPVTDAYGRLRPPNPCHREVFTDLRLCPEHTREIVSADCYGPA